MDVDGALFLSGIDYSVHFGTGCLLDESVRFCEILSVRTGLDLRGKLKGREMRQRIVEEN